MQSKIPFRIKLDDVNDNAPIFPKDFYAVNIKGSTTQGSVILTVEAIDMDISNYNSRVYYFLSGGYGKFQIDKHTGKPWLKPGEVPPDVAKKVFFIHIMTSEAVIRRPLRKQQNFYHFFMRCATFQDGSN
jgi:hypothetical protein